MERETKLKWLIVVGVLFLLSYMSYLGNLKQQSNVEPPNPVTTPGEIVATFDNGDGTENYIRKMRKLCSWKLIILRISKIITSYSE